MIHRGFTSAAKALTSRLSSRSVAAFLLPIGLCCSLPCVAADPRPLPQFERIVIDDQFPGAYQVEVADVNGDGKPDVVALGGGTCAWYENPTWKKRIVTNPQQTPGIISTATADLDGDGKAEIAIAYEFAMNQPAKGKLLLAHPGKGLDDPWTLVPVADIPSIHRLRWMHSEAHIGKTSASFGSRPAGQDREKDMRVVKWTELVVAPLFGPSAKPPTFAEEPAHLVLFPVELPKDQERTGGVGGGAGLTSKSVDPKPRLAHPVTSDQGHQLPREIGKAPVLHAIDVVDLMANGIYVVLGASNLGVTMHSVFAYSGAALYRTETLVPGAPGDAPKQGASEIHVGRLKDGRRFLATVEPWHGTDVAIYLSEPTEPFISPKFGPRTVIDSTLKDGHALWVADVDGDGDDEVFAGYRGQGTSLLGYDFDGKTWNRTVIDTAIAAQDLRGGDIDGDGTPDIVAVGGSTHNVVWYRPKKD
ncbi:Repeat domain-containing protein [Singulisphaera sp. GP187]|uniref:FG-GAP repeat domain-containing protein n=1 Tax=Singulisphaera sp. GP187 TaxID=1882752 RepID=UPI00092BFE64|nr:VCBS repeat-containing protein [Singulisphaera sp. GP187]SIO58714.1 Repeat domain-containing protein [Singulisphaera sp. GP187]